MKTEMDQYLCPCDVVRPVTSSLPHPATPGRTHVAVCLPASEWLRGGVGRLAAVRWFDVYTCV